MKNTKIEISSPPRIEKVEFIIEELDRFKDTDYYKYILYFYNILVKKLKPEDLKIFYRNINTLSIKEKIYLFSTRGTYDAEFNKITLIYHLFNEETINHELLHISSSICDYEKGVIYSGLSFLSNKIKLGNNLNEGYTELQNRRLFGSGKKEKSYEFQVIIAKLVEEIVGQEVMEKAYFSADLKQITELLKIYNNDMDTYRFIKCIDKIKEKDSIILREFKEELNTDYFRYITSFLITSYANKMYLEYLKGDITEDEYVRHIDYYTKCTMDLLSLNREYRPIFNEYRIESNIESKYKEAKSLIRK